MREWRRRAAGPWSPPGKNEAVRAEEPETDLSYFSTEEIEENEVSIIYPPLLRLAFSWDPNSALSMWISDRELLDPGFTCVCVSWN